MDDQDSLGQTWRRWILTEDEGINTKLLVVESLADHIADSSVSQRILLRENFGPEHFRQMQDAIEMYKTPRAVSATALGPSVVASELTSPHLPLWKVTKAKWDWQDEINFGNWLAHEVTTQFFVGTGIQVDCSRFGVAVRWIYAREHGLPAANTLSGSRKLFSQESGTEDWDHLSADADWKKDRRFLAGLNYILDNIYTHSIIDDLYPVAIDKQYVIPGTIDLNLYNAVTGHTQVITDVGQTGSYITVLYGNEPQSEKSYVGYAELRYRKEGEGGFLRWRWPQVSTDGTWSLVKPESMPGFSKGQFDPPTVGSTEYEMHLLEKLGISLSLGQRFALVFYEFLGQIEFRKSITVEGHFYCSVDPCDPSGVLYDSYSTPSRDGRLRETQAKFMQFIKEGGPDNPVVLDWTSTVNDYLIFPRPTLTIGDLLFNRDHALDRLQADPRLPFDERWGFARASSSWYVLQEEVWKRIWAIRDDVVDRAQNICFSAQPTSCDPNSPVLKNLDTSVMDAALKKARIEFNTTEALVDPKLRTETRDRLRLRKDLTIMCKATRSCTLDDFLSAQLPYVDQMSSKPVDPLRKRFGLEVRQ